MAAPCLVLEHVSRHYGGLRAVDDVSLTVQPGERRALIGPNGAGKTTLFNIAAGLMRPSSGRILLQGREVTRTPAHRRARRGLARTFQITNLLPALTVAENLALAVQSESRWRWDPVRPWRRHRATWRSVDELLERARLTDVRDSLVGSLPYGHQRRLEIIVAVARPSSVILLDEPGAGLSSEETEELMLLVFGLNPELAVMFIDHDVNLALRLATRVTVLHLGRVVAEGTPDEIRRRGPLDDIYLGAPAGA
jgi:branched-chain amino acid transport system ATP-binding protein